MARRLALIAVSIVLAAFAIAGGVVAWIAWFPDALRPPLERLLTVRLGQQVRIDGPLRIEPGRVTTVDIRELGIAAPDWAKADDLVAIDHLRVGADLWDYLRHGTIRVTEFVAKAPRVALERDAQQRTSWPSDGATQRGSGMPKLSLGHVEITDGHLEFIDAASQLELATTIATSTGATDGIGLQLDGSGKVRNDPLLFGLRMGGLQKLAEGGAAIAVDGMLELAATRVELKGEIKEPAALNGVVLALNVASDDPSGLLALAGRPPSGSAPPLSGSARLTGGRQEFAVDDLHAQWGDSSVGGTLHLDLSPDKPHLEGSIEAQVLDLATLLPLLASPDENPESIPPSGNPLHTLANYEGTLELAAKAIRLPSQLVLHDTDTKLELADDLLRATLRIGLPRGVVNGELVAGPLSAPELKVETRLRAADVGVSELTGDGYGGAVSGQLDGSLAVGSIQAMLAGSRMRFEGKGEDLAIPQAKLGSLEVIATLENGRLKLDPLQAKLPQGDVAGRILAGPFDQAFTADLDVTATAIDLGALARIGGVEGRLNGHLTGKLRGAQPLDLLTRSRLELKGKIDGLRLPQVERRVTEAGLMLTLDPDRREALKLTADARAGDRPLKITAFGGSFETLSANRGDYPFTIVADLGKNDIKVNGTVSMPLTEKTFAATISAEGPDPSPILALFELPSSSSRPIASRACSPIAARSCASRTSTVE